MKTAIASLILGFILAVWLTPIVRKYAIRFKLMDSPEEGRRVNTVPIPRIGGVAIALAMYGPIAGLAFYENGISDAIYQDARMLMALILGSIGALAVGLADDLIRPPAKMRLAALLLIAAFSWYGGFRMDVLNVPLIGMVDLAWASLPITMLWIVGVIVAFNFIDGLDGLAAGIALIASLTLFVMAFMENNLLWMTWMGALSGSLLGFLVFNFNPASIFMGDAGSNFLGYMMAVVALQSSRKEGTMVAILVPALALGLPILDAALTMLRRALYREGMFLSERGHLHHRLHDSGLGHKKTVLVLYGVTVVLCVAALLFLSDIRTAHIIASFSVTAVLVALMWVTGYLKPFELKRMYTQGKENKARDGGFAEVVDDLLARISSAAPEGGLERALNDLIERTTLTGVAIRTTQISETTWGQYSKEAKGVRARVLLDDERVVEFLWEGRASGPTKREAESLKHMVNTLSPKEYPE